MQTFLPFPDLAASAAALDDRRLGKQRVEALQILNALLVPGHGYRHHPAARMWRGWEPALAAYGLAICAEWVSRGRADTCAVKIAERLGAPVPSWDELAAAGEVPAWIGDPDFHAAHRSNLVRKVPAYYRLRFGDVPDDLPYVWPVGRSGGDVAPLGQDQ